MRKLTNVATLSLVLSGALSILLSHRCHAADARPVTLTEDAASYTLANGSVTAVVDKRSGGLRSFQYRGLETLDAGSGHAAAYWSHQPNNGTAAVTLDPRSNGGSQAEVAVNGVYQGVPQGSGPGGGVAADLEIRYRLGRGDTGLYTYSIFTHKSGYPATGIGEARFAAKLNDAVFDWMTVDADRNMEMITAYDWDHGLKMNMKEARRMTTGLYKGQVEHKYDYSAVQFDTPAFGWSSTARHVGLWFVNPTIEYLSGGPTKLELTAHRDATFTDSLTAPAPPTLLNYWRGSHYGGSVCDLAADETWTKVVGPFLIYANAGPTHDAMWRDALARAAAEAKQWPYDWVVGVDYPHKDARGIVTGQIILRDPQAPSAKMSHLLVGLAHPDYPSARGEPVDWQQDAKYYQFWVRGDAQGRFAIPNVRPGTYTLHAFADGVLGEYAKADVTVVAGKMLNLGTLTWTPICYGRQLWEIGVPDRTAREFRHGDHYWQWGLYNQYPKDFPNDVHYVIGHSDSHTDWNYAQVPRAQDDTGRGDGPATPWTVTFDLPTAPHGKATLRLAFAGTSARRVTVAVNGQPAGDTGPLPDTATIRRDAIRGLWRERDVAFDASLLKAGTNVLTLTVPAGGVMSGVEYDYLRLELDESAPPPDGQGAQGFSPGCGLGRMSMTSELDTWADWN